MILKIQRNYREEVGEPPIIVLECQRYEIRDFDPVDKTRQLAESMFCDEDGEVNPTITLMALNDKKAPQMFLLGHATVFVMNNEGKTVDTICT